MLVKFNMEVTNLWEYAFLDNYDHWVNELAENLSRKERWNYINDYSRHSHPVLRNYINHTFRRAQELSDNVPNGGYLFVSENSTCFDTGLFTEKYEPIYALFNKKSATAKLDWKFRGFYKESSREMQHITKLPDRVRYFSDINELYYDTKYDLRIDMDHILSDQENFERIPEMHRSLPNLAMVFRGMALQYAIVRIKENYKSAVPQYFKGKVQFLIPISLGEPSIVDLALAVSRNGDIYTGKTCLTLDMAYNNARLIARPETDWLS